MEDYLQMVSAEQKENAEVFDYRRIAEKSGIIKDYWTDNLLDLILRKENLNKAYKRVKSNCPPERMESATAQAGIADRISVMPDGYSTVLDERTPLSGGEKQRLALSRCFMRDIDVDKE